MTLSDYLRTTGTSQREFAALVDVTQGRVSQWIAGELIPEERCKLIEARTNAAITCEDLRPDLEWHTLPDGRKVWTKPVKRAAA